MLVTNIYAPLAAQSKSFTVEVPSRGPIVGAPVGSGHASCVQLAGEPNPAYGDALGAAFVPGSLDEQSNRFVAAGDLQQVVRLRPITCDRRTGWFEAKVQTAFLEDGPGEVLMTLIYNEWKYKPGLPRNAAELFAAAPAAAVEDAAQAIANELEDDVRAIPLSYLNLPDQDVIIGPLRAVLEQYTYGQLKSAVIALRS